ncbi:MAG TPA: hypothetical protein VK172_12120 [Lentimicrobium sp.]|nr:hypothetical protein [Lentimicrobium sp.]
MKKLSLLIILSFAFLFSFSQKRLTLNDEKQIITRAVTELNDAFARPDGIMYKKIAALNLSGTYIYDVTIRNKGAVATVFSVNSGDNDIKIQNRIKDLIYEYKLSFNMLKGKSYKFRYTLNF